MLAPVGTVQARTVVTNIETEKKGITVCVVLKNECLIIPFHSLL